MKMNLMKNVGIASVPSVLSLSRMAGIKNASVPN